MKAFYKDALRFCELINPESGEQYCFLRALINKDGQYIKVEWIQNIQILFPVEVFEQVKVLSIQDIGILKLLSASSRKAKIDIYDLDLITETVPLEILFDLLIEKQQKYGAEIHKNLFDLDGGQ